MQEGIVWRQLNHPNVLPFMGIYYLDTQQRQLCLVSPWMEEGNLVEFLQNTKEPVDRLLRVRLSMVAVLIQTSTVETCQADVYSIFTILMQNRSVC